MDVIAPRSVAPRRESAVRVKHVEEGCPYREDDVMAPEKGVSTGTTIMAVEFDGGVVLGADTRTSTGQYVANRASRKITKMDERIFVCRCGSAADTQALSGFVQFYLGQHAVELGRKPAVKTCANLFKIFAYNNKDRLMAGMIVAGWDEKNGGQVYNIPIGGSLIRTGWACDGSGSGYIAGLMDSTYRPGMSKAECVDFVATSVSHAMARDGSSGGMVRMVVVTKDGLEETNIEGNKLPFGP
mmetsp:Transcript_95371/g.266403  ORF Transcript_95371/g.266403 Transcript_95371/m.266403 type:complete len:242 (-) Transcript_95371:153-878(-)